MSEPANRETPTPAGPTLLVVDDSSMMRTLIKRAAAATGVPIAQIHEAGNGQEALDVLETQHVDAVFTDINMPVMTGIELLRRMAGREQWRDIVRVVISTDGSAARHAEADALGVRLYVQKPFRPEVMRDVLTSLTAAR
jgi:two-component system, chemotaxis family, chemotaxis protein CheY